MEVKINILMNNELERMEFQMFEPTNIKGYRIAVTDVLLNNAQFKNIVKILSRNSEPGDYSDVLHVKNVNSIKYNALWPVWEFSSRKKTEDIRKFLLNQGFVETDVQRQVENTT